MKEKFRYKKEMGQNFIFDRDVIEKLAVASMVERTDGVLEIGPGRGTLTAALAMRAKKVIAVELDRTLIDDLQVNMALYPNVEIIQGDILQADLKVLSERLGTPCRVAANLPYNITTPFIEKLLHAKLPFETVAIMVQKEVGMRMMATESMEGYGPLSILVQYYADAKEVVSVPATCFTPRPSVDSSFMLLMMRKQPAVQVIDEAMFFNVIRMSFMMRRKTLLNNLLGAGLGFKRETIEMLLATCGLSPTLRGEQLSIAQFGLLADTLKSHVKQITCKH